jgi:hypothetical protein
MRGYRNLKKMTLYRELGLYEAGCGPVIKTDYRMNETEAYEVR